MVSVALEDKFVDTRASLARLAEQVASGELALPEMQRPFVWKAVNVRDLFDSLFRGYPVGNIMMWRTRSEAVKTIGTNDKEAEASLLLIDGQQRVTSVYAVLTGSQVIGVDYRPKRLVVAFRPSDGRFETANSAIAKDPEWIPDITEAFTVNPIKLSKEFIARLEKAGRSLNDDELDAIEVNLSRLTNLPKFMLAVVELKEHADVEDVAEVFVRTNNGGKTLGQSDFVLTLMSVHAQKERMGLEEWVKAAHTKEPFRGGKSPWNPHLVPDATQLVRVIAALAFRRAALRDVYAFLRGSEADSAEERDARFAIWSAAQCEVLSTHHWHEFLRVLDTAGYRSGKQINSDFAVLATYALWLHGRRCEISFRLLENVLARWFYAATVTGRYSGSSESTLASDLHALTRDEVDMVEAIERRLTALMTDDFFSVTLPENLDTRSWSNKAMFAYEAAQVVLDAPVLFAPNNEKVAHRLAPTTATVKGIERHHLFPKAYLRRETGLAGAAWSALSNRPANSSLVDWVENGDISDDAPADYWPTVTAGLATETFASQMAGHALYEGWWEDDYDTFCARRRGLMAAIIKDGYNALLARRPTPRAPDAVGTDIPDVAGLGAASAEDMRRASAVDPREVTLSNLIAAELVLADEPLTHLLATAPGTATVNADGTLTVDGVRYDSPSSAARALTDGHDTDGWSTWAVTREDAHVTLEELREAYAADPVQT